MPISNSRALLSGDLTAAQISCCSLSTISFGVPAGTPKEIVDKLQQEICAAVKSPDNKARLLEMGIVPEGDSPASFAAYVKADIAKWKRVIEQANVPKI